ncbi:hypothetical protein K435DRAFT_810099 [Dendrothele bispora CBS 962.96]|uniref:Uncharacterized protein n=1 Tax=Dendrothele bispora (strain CBS 962.96) TaxID=1314807 RepID=A0A4S8KX66_DENBC|nr:hypothetical protein K435DRAFT_810099 [Dendrothele bispora CBS 962.96]
MFPITLPFISSWTASDKDSFKTVGWFKKSDRSYSFMSSPWRSIQAKEGILLEHGWTRFHYDGTNWGRDFSCYVNLPQELETKLVAAWLCQGIFYDNATRDDTSDLEQHSVTTGVDISLVSDVGTVVLHPNIIPKNIFILIAPVSLKQCPESGSTEVSWGEHGENYYFWSFDPDGSTQISQRVCDLIGLPKYKAETYAQARFCFNIQFQAIQQVQKFFGYDPLTRDFAKACGLPLIEVIPLSKDPDKSHVYNLKVQPVRCAKCGTWFWNQSSWARDIIVLKLSEEEGTRQHSRYKTSVTKQQEIVGLGAMVEMPDWTLKDCSTFSKTTV